MQSCNSQRDQLIDATQNYTYGLAEQGVIISEERGNALFKITLLEKVELIIQLSSRGFKIVELKSLDKEANLDYEQKISIHTGATFETMDALLFSVSPAFARKHSEELSRKLSAAFLTIH
ncbi:hypothetical protein K7432_000100 [Basidiobolus ranarum]|uniref:GSKIP domain-containing protein n=1 Tax=Basidiobolus ranarum TaxID=34480 RepID=A0ABR2X548_9FUNG